MSIPRTLYSRRSPVGFLLAGTLVLVALGTIGCSGKAATGGPPASAAHSGSTTSAASSAPAAPVEVTPAQLATLRQVAANAKMTGPTCDKLLTRADVEKITGLTNLEIYPSG